MAVTPESLVQAVTGGHIQIEVNEGAFLKFMVEQVEPLAKCINGFEWRVLVAPPDTGFIICDHPFVLVPPKDQPDHELHGFGVQVLKHRFGLRKPLRSANA